MRAKILFLIIVLIIGTIHAEIVLEEGFDSTTIPTGWTQENVAGNVSWMTYTGGHNGNPSGPQSGARNAYIFAETCTTKLITPLLNIGGSNSAELTFYYAHAEWFGELDVLRVYYKDEPDDDWNLLETYDDNVTDWEFETISLPAESSSYYIAFEAECNWGHGCVIDEVTVEGDPSPVGIVEGHVYSEAGIPLTGAIVSVEDTGQSGETLPGGFYQILAIPEGNHPFFASLDGYGFDQLEAEVVAGQTTTIDFNLQEYEEVMVSGRVISSEDGSPIQGALVHLEGFEEYEVNTAATGDFLIPNVYSDNEYELTVSKDTYNPYEATVIVEQENLDLDDLTLIAPIDISGWVNTTANPDSGLAGAVVVLSGYEYHSVNTAATGEFLITDVYANEDYDISITYDNHNPFETSVEVIEDDIDFETVTLISPIDLSGHIVSTNDPETGLDGAEISLSGYAYHNAETDSLGNFVITEIYANEDYDMVIEYPDHNPYEVEIEAGEDHIDLGTVNLIGPVTVDGYVYGSDDLENGLEGAELVLSGYEYHSTTTDSTGYYAFEGVYANEDYQISVEAEGYDDYEAEVEVESINLELENIIVNESTNPAGNVNAEIIEDTSVQLVWNLPGEGNYEFRYDDGTPVSEIGLNGPRAVVGAAHHYNAVVNQVQWYLTNAHTHPSVKIYIFGLTYNGTPNGSDLLYESNTLSGTSNQWRTYTLPSPVYAPNGFFVGICAPNHWTDLATDNGTGEPWEFQPGTQFASEDYEEGDWMDIDGVPGYGNFLIRAYGIKLGPPQDRELEGYEVYRLPEEEMGDMEEWQLIAEGIQDTTYTDEYWWHLEEDDWVYAVRCVHTNGIYSIATFSNSLEKTDDPDELNVVFNIYDPQGEPVYNADCDLLGFWNNYGTHSDADGIADYDDVFPGIYDLVVEHDDYALFEQEGILIEEDFEMDVYLENLSEENNEIVSSNGLYSIHPNPFNPETEVSFILSKADHVNICVYNSKGQLQETLCDREFTEGEHTLSWEADDQPSGVYFIYYQTSSVKQVKKAVLLK